MVIEYRDKLQGMKTDKKKGQKPDAATSLATAVIMMAVNDYGKGYTDKIYGTKMIHEQDYESAKSFLSEKNDQYDFFMNIINSDEYLPGECILAMCERHAREGRWIPYSRLNFTRKKDAVKMLLDHQKWTQGMKVYKNSKTGKYKIRIPKSVEEENLM